MASALSKKSSFVSLASGIREKSHFFRLDSQLNQFYFPGEVLRGRWMIIVATVIWLLSKR